MKFSLQKRPPPGVDPAQWGPSAWYVVHTVALALDFHFDHHHHPMADTPSITLIELLWALFAAMPCSKCRISVYALLERGQGLELDLDGQTAKWSWRLHNAVNAKLRKPHWPHGPPHLGHVSRGRGGPRGYRYQSGEWSTALAAFERALDANAVATNARAHRKFRSSLERARGALRASVAP